MKRCHRCGHDWVSDKRQPGVKETCPGCNAYLHCCLNCRFHDKSRHNECQIPNTEWVGDRAGCNFCDEFEFVTGDRTAKDADKKNAAQTAFDSMFGGGDEDGLSEKGRDAFDKLFGD